MKRLLATLILGATSFAVAKADPVTGLVSVGGSATYSNTSITFTGPGSVFGTSTGTLQAIPLCDQCVTFPVNPFVYGAGFITGLPIFDIVNGGLEVILTVTSIDSLSGVDGFGDLLVRGSGTLSQTGYTPTASTFALSSQFGGTGASVSFSNSTAAQGVTPEPNSLVLLGTGILGASALFRRSKRASETTLDFGSA